MEGIMKEQMPSDAKESLLEEFESFSDCFDGDLPATDDNDDLDAWFTMDDAEAMLDERDIGEDMAFKCKKETLLPMQIWIDEAFGYRVRGRASRIAFLLDTSDRQDSDYVGWMDFDGNIHQENQIVGKLGEDELAQLRNFVRNNRSALEQLADMNIHLYQIWPDIIKGGKPASAEEIKALDDKVAELVEANKKEWEKHYVHES